MAGRRCQDCGRAHEIGELRCECGGHTRYDHDAIPDITPTVDRTTVTDVDAWRLKCLLDAGYELEHAEQLAGRRDVDLHQAVELARTVVGNGRPAELAARILL